MPKPKNGRARNKKGRFVKVSKEKLQPKKLKKIKSPRQILAIKKISEILRKSKGQKGVTLGRILRESGYAPSTSKAPSRVIETKSFQDLLDESLPDDVIIESHGGVLQAMKLDHYVFPKSEKDEVIKEIIESVPGCKLMKIRTAQQWKRAYYWTPDNQSRMKAIAEAYKVKAKYPAEKHEIGVDKELREALDRIDKVLPK